MKVINNILKLLLLGVFCVWAAALVSSENKITSETSVSEVPFSHDVESLILDINHNVNTEIFNLPKVYILPMDQSPAPRPNPANFTEDTYEDETISVKCWRERITVSQKTVTANFADVTIAHPTQLRTAFSGGDYSLSKRSPGTRMAAFNNAVLAVNADFYNFRVEGVIVRQGKTYRKKPAGVDTLFIDANGNFTVMNDRAAVNTSYIKTQKIWQTLAFGPVIVLDGKPIKKLKNFNSIAPCGPRASEPRTAIGQLGKLHYLVCTIDGRSDISAGLTTNELAVVMADKKCSVAYNLDGGQSTTMVFNNQLYNVVSDGGERNLSDILYFATGVPESEWS